VTGECTSGSSDGADRFFVGHDDGCSGCAGPDVGWSAYGGDAGGTRYSTAAQITPANVDQLEVAWTFRTGELGQA